MSAIRRGLVVSRNAAVTTRTSPRQVKNNTDGFVYQVSDKSRLERFLILGTDGGTFYVGERDITRENLSFVDELIRRDPQLVYEVTSSVSTSGRAYRNTPAIYVAAKFICACPDSYKLLAKKLISDVCRTSTHIFELCGFIDTLGGWGQAKMDAVRRWYESKSTSQLAYQVVKYRGGRYGWTHRDVFRTVHPRGIDQRLGAAILGKPVFANLDGDGDLLDGFLLVQSAKTAKDVVRVLSEYPRLPWEAIPTQFLRDPDIWKQLFKNGQLNGLNLLRNVRRLDEIGALNDLSFARSVGKELATGVRGAHPIQYVNTMGATGMLTSADRYSFYGNRTMIRSGVLSGPVADGLETGFYNSFGNVEESSDSILLGVDVSASMSWAAPAGLKNVTAAQAAGIMAMVFARRNPAYMIRGFCHTFVDLGISSTDSLSQAMAKVQKNNFGSTDASVPIRYAEEKSIRVDKFIILTDNEVNTGRHPKAALDSYRRKVNDKAKLIVVGMTATNFTIADPSDTGMLDVVGFDTSAPDLIRNF